MTKISWATFFIMVLISTVMLIFGGYLIVTSVACSCEGRDIYREVKHKDFVGCVVVVEGDLIPIEEYRRDYMGRKLLIDCFQGVMQSVRLRIK